MLESQNTPSLNVPSGRSPCELPVLSKPMFAGADPSARLHRLLLCLEPAQFDQILDSFQEPKKAQITWLRKLLDSTAVNTLTDFTLNALDFLSKTGYPGPLAEALNLCPPEQVFRSLGFETCVWAFLNKHAALPHRVARVEQTSLRDGGELSGLIQASGINPDILRAVADVSLIESGFVNTQKILDIYFSVAERFPELKLIAFADLPGEISFRTFRPSDLSKIETAATGARNQLTDPRLMVVLAEHCKIQGISLSRTAGQVICDAIGGSAKAEGISDTTLNDESDILKKLRSRFRLCKGKFRGSPFAKLQREAVKNLIKNQADHFPQNISLPALENIALSGKNPQILQYVVSALPPGQIVSAFGLKDALPLLIWAAVNFSAPHSSVHHTSQPCLDFSRLMNFLEANPEYPINSEQFASGQLLTWWKCQGSVDVELVMANYELVRRHETFGFNNASGELHMSGNDEVFEYPIDKLLQYHLRWRPQSDYGFSKLRLGTLSNVSRLEVEGSDEDWRGRHYDCRIKGHEGVCIRTWSGSARIESLVGFALTLREKKFLPLDGALSFPKLPIAVISFYCHRRSDGEIELLIAQIQGAQPEIYVKKEPPLNKATESEDQPADEIELPVYRYGEKLPLQSPGQLHPDFREILTELVVVEIVERLKIDCSIRGGVGSSWRKSVEKIRPYDAPFHRMKVFGESLRQDEDQNFSLPHFQPTQLPESTGIASEVGRQIWERLLRLRSWASPASSRET